MDSPSGFLFDGASIGNDFRRLSGENESEGNDDMDMLSYFAARPQGQEEYGGGEYMFPDESQDDTHSAATAAAASGANSHTSALSEIAGERMAAHGQEENAPMPEAMPDDYYTGAAVPQQIDRCLCSQRLVVSTNPNPNSVPQRSRVSF